MTRGQESLTIDMGEPALGAMAAATPAFAARPRQPVIVTVPTDAELALHRAYLEALDRESKGRCVWLALENVAAAA
jgi:DNA polymerase-3 subunit epsilon